MSTRTTILAAAAGLALVTGCSQEGKGDNPAAATSDAATGTVAASLGARSV